MPSDDSNAVDVAPEAPAPAEVELEEVAPSASSDAAAPDESEPTAVAQMFAAVGIARVIFVDDIFALSEDRFLEVLAKVTPEQRAELLDLDVERMKQEVLWQQDARGLWNSKGRKDQTALADALFAVEADLTEIEHGSLNVLSELAPDVELLPLSLGEWQTQKEALIAELGDKPTLILFDQDFSHEAGGENVKGEQLVKELQDEIAKASAPGTEPLTNAYYGLLTNTASIEQELDRRREIVDQSGIDPARFVLIAKENFREDERERFASRLRTTMLAPVMAELMESVAATTKKTRDAAISETKALTPEEMERIVVRSSATEGVWPPDTLVRILEVLQRSVVRESLRSEDRVIELTRILSALAQIETGDEVEADTNATPSSIQIANKEIYETADHVNSLCLPIEMGDVFVRGADGQRFIVICQPCDLMVRSNGHRQPEVSHFLLAKVDEATVEGDGGSDASEDAEGATPASEHDLFSRFKLPYFNATTGAHAFVNLKQPWIVRSLVLDACVLNKDGKSRLDETVLDHPELLPAWRVRRQELLKTRKSILKRTKSTTSQDGQKAIAGFFKKDPFQLVQVDEPSGVLEWDCVRDGRVCDPYSRALLSRFSQFFARDAYLHDLTRFK